MTEKTSDQREFFRVGIRLDTKFKIIQPGEVDLDVLFQDSHQGSIVDLSGGGAGIVSQVSIQPGTLLKINLTDLGVHIPPIEATVIRVESLDEDSYKAAVKFENIAEKDVKKIIAFLNQHVRKQSRQDSYRQL